MRRRRSDTVAYSTLQVWNNGECQQYSVFSAITRILHMLYFHVRVSISPTLIAILFARALETVKRLSTGYNHHTDTARFFVYISMHIVYNARPLLFKICELDCLQWPNFIHLGTALVAVAVGVCGHTETAVHFYYVEYQVHKRVTP